MKGPSVAAVTGLALAACGGSESSTGLGSRGSGLRTLGPAVHYSTNGIRVGKTVIGDLNGDGRNDVAVIASSGYGQVILVYYQNSSGTLEPPLVITTDVGLRGIAIGDVNGDGKADLVVSGLAVAANSGWLSRIVVLLQDPTTGQLLPGRETPVSANNVGDLAIGDLNSDGRNDIAVLAEWTSVSGMGNLCLFYQNSDGTLQPEVIYNKVPVMYTGEIHIADLNGDGRNDVVLQTNLLVLGVITQTATGTLSDTPVSYDVQTSYWPNVSAFAVGDVNGDGRPDIAVIDPGNNGYLNVFLQGSGGTLTRVLADTIGPPYGIEIADIDGDGLNDILGDFTFPSVPTSLGAVEVFYQTRDHRFGSSTVYEFPTTSGGGSAEHQSLAVGDVTGDGKPDAVMTWADEGLWVLPSVPK